VGEGPEDYPADVVPRPQAVAPRGHEDEGALGRAVKQSITEWLDIVEYEIRGEVDFGGA
jgi:hypothetical protein